MNHEETVMLTRLVAAACPQQVIDEFTPDAWHDLLGDLSFADCHAAMKVIGKRQPFMAPAEIIAEVRHIRADRIARSVIAAPPPELADDPAAYRRALGEGVRQAADGLAPPAEQRLAIAGGRPRPEIRESRPPATLRTALAEFRRALGPARPRRPSADPQEIARQQAEAARAEREAREAQEGREAS